MQMTYIVLFKKKNQKKEPKKRTKKKNQKKEPKKRTKKKNQKKEQFFGSFEC
jgi:hypothetical protein